MRIEEKERHSRIHANIFNLSLCTKQRIFYVAEDSDTIPEIECIPITF